MLAAIPAHRHFPPEAAMPLLLGELLPDDVERVLFLDADLLVLDDPTGLLEADLGGRALAAAVDGAIALCSGPRGVRAWREQGIPAFAPYFNAGVMAISLRDWRERAVGARALRHLSTGGTTGGGFLHQEALNAVAWDDWHELDPRWNVLASHAGRPYSQAPPPEHPGIVHFAGRMKPWRGGLAGPYATPYRAALAEVAPLLPAPAHRLRDRALSAYDRRLRDRLFPLERALWRRGLI
jgi:lipopolysaccharide biosynthesis glycosyltransferase